MSQLGAGLVGSGDPTYPEAIDTYQTFVNGTPIAPDSNTRFDSELVMDILRTLINIETVLGTNPQGGYGSLAARLNAHIPSVPAPNILAFTNVLSLAVPGTDHKLGSKAIVSQVYAAGFQLAAMQPQSLTVDPTTYDVLLTFAAPQSGLLVLAVPSPTYLHPFTNQTTVSIPGSTHGLGLVPLIYQAYDAATPAAQIQPGQLTIHPMTLDVTLSFAGPQSGLLVLTTGGSSRYVQAFTNSNNVTILGDTHGLASTALLYQIYDTLTPATAIQPGTLSVNETNFDVNFTFPSPMSGTILLAAAQPPPGP